jgi:hypothetical protein
MAIECCLAGIDTTTWRRRSTPRAKRLARRRPQRAPGSTSGRWENSAGLARLRYRCARRRPTGVSAKSPIRAAAVHDSRVCGRYGKCVGRPVSPGGRQLSAFEGLGRAFDIQRTAQCNQHWLLYRSSLRHRRSKTDDPALTAWPQNSHTCLFIFRDVRHPYDAFGLARRRQHLRDCGYFPTNTLRRAP